MTFFISLGFSMGGRGEFIVLLSVLFVKNIWIVSIPVTLENARKLSKSGKKINILNFCISRGVSQRWSYIARISEFVRMSAEILKLCVRLTFTLCVVDDPSVRAPAHRVRPVKQTQLSTSTVPIRAQVRACN